jgi:hypothetical protein
MWSLFNSSNTTVKHVMNYAMLNTNSTLGENMKYFMYKYDIPYDMWAMPVYNILNKCDKFNNKLKVFREEDTHAILIRDLCILRDSSYHDIMHVNDIIYAINYYSTL